MDNHKYLHFTLGPVQGFVAQARRTRDFWAGSFLLSWLSGVAMAAVEQQHGKIEFPIPSEGYLDWIRGRGSGDAPRQGAIPNRFKATVPAGFDAAQVVETVRDAWLALAEQVWREDLRDIGEGTVTRDIWERQHGSFWEINWVLTASEASDVLDRRKNWRSHLHQPEPGVKCMIMDGWQDLSGIESPHSKMLAEFWETVRAQPHKKGLQTDLAEGERLCAMAFVKRRFARHFATFHADIGDLHLQGWQLPVAVPSVSYMAAVHWMQQLLKEKDAATIERVLRAAKDINPAKDEWESNIRCLREACDQGNKVARHLIALDAKVFFEHERHNKKVYPDQDKAKVLDGVLKDLKLDAPLSPFYAILLMDGDSLGSFMADATNQPKIAQALNTFTGRVLDIVYQHNGFLIYAGGDDVLAVLPLEDAFPCAQELRGEYSKAFGGTGIPSTLSGAIEFAHVKMPLGRVLADAHDLLDNVAKDGRGRDAIAARVWKPGGCVVEWAQPWEIALGGSQLVLQHIADTFEQWESAAQPDGGTPYSNKFFYKIRDLFELLNPTEEHPEAVLGEDEVLGEDQAAALLLPAEPRPKRWAGLDEGQAAALLAAEYLSSGVNEGHGTKPTLKKAQELLQPLLGQCRPVKRETDPNGNNPRYDKKSKRLEADGALLVRFLAHKGVDETGGER